jgi:hypothetical protein
MEQESAEALEYIGFTQETADEIWSNFQQLPPDSPDDLLSYIQGHIEGCDTNGLSDRDALTKMGLSTDFKDRLLDPNFSSLFFTEKLKFWVTDFLQGAFLTIGELLERSASWAGRSLHAESSNRPPRVSFGDTEAQEDSDKGKAQGDPGRGKGKAQEM